MIRTRDAAAIRLGVETAHALMVAGYTVTESLDYVSATFSIKKRRTQLSLFAALRIIGRHSARRRP